MSARLHVLIAVSIFIVMASGIPRTIQAGEVDSALGTKRQQAGSPRSDGGNHRLPTNMASQTSTRTRSAIPECDGEAQPTGAIPSLFQRITGGERPPDVRLCAVPKDVQAEEEAPK